MKVDVEILIDGGWPLTMARGGRSWIMDAQGCVYMVVFCLGYRVLKLVIVSGILRIDSKLGSMGLEVI